MRVISPYKKYSITVFPPVERIVTDSRGTASQIILNVSGDDEVYVADFDQSGLLPHEADLALRAFNFSGIAEGVNPLSTIGVWDSEAAALQHAWSDSRHKAVCDRFKELAKVYTTAILICDDLTAPKPWPTYDEMEPEEILQYQQILGVSPESIWRYENENAKRDLILDIMQGKLSDVAVGEIVVQA